MDARRWNSLILRLALGCLCAATGRTGTVSAELRGTDSRTGPTVRLRFEWGNPQPQQWHGLLEMDAKGRFSRLRSLSLEADSEATIGTNGQTAWISRRFSRIYDGFDVDVTAPVDTRLILTLQTEQVDQRFETTVWEVCRAGVTFSMADGGRLVIRRAPGDALRVRMDRPHLVYAVGERFAAHIQPNPLTRDPVEVSGELNWTVSEARSGEPVLAGGRSATLSTNSAAPTGIPVQFPLPADEGVYDIRFSLTSPQLPVLRSEVQVVVLSGGARGRSIASETVSAAAGLGSGKSSDGRQPRNSLSSFGSETLVDRVVPDRGPSPREIGAGRRLQSTRPGVERA
ncbi:MAG TPA: hypothetical protein EYP14_03035, partial [Planctomycetaceae bacterium]|nr:hypothetical protein [Planctomycetaceae bacterium]